MVGHEDPKGKVKIDAEGKAYLFFEKETVEVPKVEETATKNIKNLKNVKNKLFNKKV